MSEENEYNAYKEEYNAHKEEILKHIRTRANTGDLLDEYHKAVQSPTFKTMPEKAKLEELKQALFEKTHKCRKLAEKYFYEADGCDWELNRNARLQGARYMEGIADALEDIIIDCDLVDEFIDYERARSFRKKGEE